MRRMVVPDGRRVVLTIARWEHIVDAHEGMEAHLEAIVAAVAAPTVHRPGREEGEEWIFLAGADSRRWVQVVVHFFGDEGTVATAFGRRRVP